MKLAIAAIGRIKSGPERELIDAYVKRAGAVGRTIALGPVEERELDSRHLKDRAAQTAALVSAAPDGAAIFLLDERGEQVSSRDLAREIAALRDRAVPAAAFLIGGPDGHDPNRAPAGAKSIAFGRAVWPHKLARVMLAEQLYRACSVLAGAPYHRD